MSVGVDIWGVDFGLLGWDGLLLVNFFYYCDYYIDGIVERVF